MIARRLEVLIKQPISYLEKSGLGTRAQNALERAGLDTIEAVLCKTSPELFKVSGYDVATHKQLMAALADAGIYKQTRIKKVHTYALEGATQWNCSIKKSSSTVKTV